ncbi:MAG: hypothetical protein ABIO16_10225 [Nocardioides sp.]
MTAERSSSRPRRWVVGLLVAGAVLGLATWWLLRDSSYVAHPPGPEAPQAQPAGAAVALQSLVEAFDDGDARAAAALAPADDAKTADLLAAVARNVGALGIRPLMRYVDESGGVAANGRWAAAVSLTWRYVDDSGTDPGQAEITVDFVPADAGSGGAVAVAGLGAEDSGRLPVWLSGPVVVRPAPGVLVVVAGQGAIGRAEAVRYVRLSETALRVVHRVLPAWHSRLVVEVPASGAGVDRAIGADPGHSRGIAAVTAPVDGSTTGDAPVHVFVNPDVFDTLRPTGAQVVLSHEAVHVATDAARSVMPTWLLEGFADYVALRDVDIPVSTSAGQIIRQVRQSGVPDALPGPAEFDTSTTHLGATYESAWLACVVLAERGGEAALVGLYDDVDAGRDLGSVLDRRFELTEAALTHLWQRRLETLAG